jgi:hypothetical protein
LGLVQEEEKMKRGKKLMALFAVLLVVVGAAVLVTNLNGRQTQGGDTSITVFSLDPKKVTKLSWDYSDEANFTKTEDGWVNDADPAFPVKESSLEQMLKVLSNVRSNKTITEVEDLDQYGLLYPYCAISVTVDGTKYDIAIGAPNPHNGNRYFSNGDGNVYMVDNSILSYFAFGPEGALAMEEIPNLTSMTALKFQSAARNYEILYEKGSDKTYSSHYTWFMDGKVLDTELTKTLLEVVQQLAWKKCADYNATDLAKYGLDTPAAVATATYGDKTFVLEFGSTTTDGVYVRIANSKMVYLVASNVLDKLLYTTYNELMPDEVLAMDWDTVTSMEITLAGKTYIFTQEQVPESEGSTATKLVWKLDGKEVAATPITEALQGMDSKGYATDLQPQLAEEIRVVFHRNTQHHSKVELVLYRHDSSTCLTTLDGVSTVLADLNDVTGLINTVNLLVKQ